jgi:hypothetical protein
MSDVIQNTGQEFWRSPTVLEPLVETAAPAPLLHAAESCADCGSEFMIGARFCHTCGLRRPKPADAASDARIVAGLSTRSIARLREGVASASIAWHKISFPSWLQYLHFHEIQRWVGLPIAPLIAFIIGLGCVAGAVGVSLFYRASNLAEFQAIQMWRVEWLLGATASFVAGILLKKPSDSNRD